jgi:hypothetical protein
MASRAKKKQSTDKSEGPDGLHPALLKGCIESMARPLSMIFSKSFESGELPAERKTAHIVPIYKKGSRSDPANYRPISLTSVACKLMESIIKDEVTQFLQENKMR